MPGLGTLSGTPEEQGPRLIGTSALHPNGMLTLEGTAPYPVLVSTGDDHTEAARFAMWKRQWIAAFPERYADMLRNPLETAPR